MPAVLPAQNGQSNGGLEEARRPLLPTQTADSGGSDSDAEGGELPMTSGYGGSGCSTAGGVANLVTTAVGAGMVALPRAVSETGILLGMSLFAFTAVLTYASTSIIVRYACRGGFQSYGDLVKHHFGPKGSAILQLAICVHVGGVMVGYCVIIADVLVGSAPAYTGMLPTLLGRHDNPWFLSRPAVLALLLAAVVAPMLVPRSLASVAKFSSFSVAMVLGLAAAISGLAAAALVEGRVADDVRLLPDAATMGGGTPLGILTSVLTVVSVSALSFTCHFNLLPIRASLKNPSRACMLRVIRLALAVCAAIYGTVAVSGYALFGSATDGDVLKNLTARFVASLVPVPAAHALVYGIATAFSFNLLVNFVLKVWAVRDNLCELALRQPALQLANRPFYAVTALLVAAAYGISILVPSIYGLLSLVGATACVTFSYIFPGLLVLRCQRSALQRGGAAGLLALGAAMAGIALHNRLTGRGGE
ncbi:hypothetical protein ABPG77_001377 [Micractinium sp. CCAP 211/92]